MRRIKKIIFLPLLLVCLSFMKSSIAQKLAYQEYENDSVLILKAQVSNQNFDVKSYDKSSIVKASNISYQTLQGNWQSYKGILAIGDEYNPMNLFKPLIIEFDSNKIRHSESEKFDLFIIRKREIISQSKEHMGIINKITDKVLVITLFNGFGWSRYYYERKL